MSHQTWMFIRGLLIVLGGIVVAGWVLWRTLKRSEDPARVAFKLFVTFLILGMGGWAVYERTGYSMAGAFIVPFVCVFIGIALSIVWSPHVGAAMARPLTSLFDGGSEPPVPTPRYSVAESRRKQQKFREAIYEIHEQLAKFPNDVQLQLLLAEIQAEDLQDLQAAQLTLERFCAQDHAPKNIAFALNSLADWHLKLAKAREGALAALEKIISRLPNTEEAHLASQRIAHLASNETLHASMERQPIHLREGEKNMGLRTGVPSAVPVEETPDQTVDRLVQHLGAYPLDIAAREKLAVLYGDHFQRPDLAAEQFDQIITAPSVPAKDVVRCLNLMADAQVKHGSSYEAIRSTLQRVIDLYPDRASAELARQRMEHIRLELKGKEMSQTVRLGSYEKDLGLKDPGRDQRR